MRTLKALALVLPLTLCGCLLTTGQFAIDYDLGTINVTDSDNLVAEQVDLNTVEDYTDHKDDLVNVSDLALLGEVTNNQATPLEVEAWISTSTTNYTSEAQVRANAIRLWGPIAVPANGTVQIDWDDSAALFAPYGKPLLLTELKEDGIFTVYLMGTGGDYDFTVENTTLVVTVEGED